MFDDDQEEKLDLPKESVTSSLNRLNSNGPFLKKIQSVSVVDVRMRKSISGRQTVNNWKDLQNSLNKKDSNEPLAAKLAKEKYVTPYVIYNKTDLAIVVQRLFRRGEKQSIEANTFNEKMKSVVIQKTNTILDKQDQKKHSQVQEDLDDDKWLETGPLTQKAYQIRLYWIKQGTLQDYLVDYNKEAGTKINKQLIEYLKQGKKGLYPADPEEWDSMIHSDVVGEYVSEYVKIKFDRTSPELTYNKDQFQENLEIKQADLNQIGYQKHILRERDQEEIYYGCKLIDNGKKIFTIRSKYQLVNFTGYDYLVAFTFKACKLVKYLESGDSLPLSTRFDECHIQVKIIDEELIDSLISAGKTKDIKSDRYVFEEESVYLKQQIADFKTKYQNWSALIPIKTLKDKLKINASSFLTNGKSKFTFIRKIKSQIHGAIDINLMPPIIVHNSLPFIITLQFLDSSNEKQILVLEKDEERNLFCFSMASSVFVDIEIAGFKTITNFKLFDLERYESNEYQLQVFDNDGRKTVLYAQVSKNLAGQRINFYCKRIFIDALDSKLVFLYKDPLINENNIINQIPSIEQRVLNQKFYIIPELTSISNPYVALIDQNQGQPLNLEVTGTQMQFDLVSQRIRYSFSYINDVFLASPFEDTYTTITSFSPQYVLVNQSNTTVYLEQSQIMKQLPRPEQRRQLVSLQVNSGQRKEVNFNCFDDKRFEEFMHIKIEDEIIKFEVEKSKDQPEGKILSLTKKYQFSCPFEISSIQKFNLKIVPQEELDVATKKDLFFIKDKNQLAKAKAELSKPKYFNINCRGNLGGEASAIGSIFIVVQEELESKCEYQIINLSSFYTLLAKQYIDIQNSNYKALDFSNVQNKDLILYPVPRLNPNLQIINEPCVERFVWSSILDEKLLKISFLFNSNQAIRHDIAHQRIKVKFNNLNESQNERAIKQNNIVDSLLIPFDRLGHVDEFEIEAIGINKKSKLKLEITTNGFTKILTISDMDNIKTNQIVSQTFEAQRVFRSSTDVTDKIALKQIEFRIDSLHLSLMHRKQELLSIFIAKTQIQIEENDDLCKIDFSLGYFQIDNQLEHVKEAPASVLIRPRDLHYDQDGFIRFRLENEDEEERREREKFGLKTLTDEVSKVIQGSLQINNQASNNNKNILIVENMMFLIQTLSIRAQFRHALRVLASFYDFSKRLNYSVTKVHYIFQSDDALKIAALESKTQMAEEIQNQQVESGQSSKKELKLSQKKIAIYNEIQQQFDYDSQKQNQKQSIKFQLNKRTNKASHMSTTDANWQLSSKVRVSKGSWRIFIKQYQSSPLEVVVSVYNEKIIAKQISLNEKKKVNNDQIVQNKDSDDEQDDLKLNSEYGGGQDPDEILGGPKDDLQIEQEMQALMSAKYEKMADRLLAVSSFEDMLFRMNGINVTNIFGDGGEVISQIAIYHRESLKLNVLALIGSSNFIGNPSKMVNNIGTGVTDFFVKPYQGMKNGSILNASVGFAKGSKSLLKNAFLAPVGAISKIGNGFSRGALALACDEEFAQEKILDDKKNAPQHVGDGFVKGVSSAGTSIWSGVKGVVTKPIDGAKEDGFGGFFKGIGRGAAGLVGKTVSGVVDIVGKTTEGIDNQLKQTQIKQATKKIRHPRIFYETIHVLRPYNESHSNWIQQLRQIYNTQISQRSLYELFTIHEGIQNTVVNNKSWIEVRGSLFVFSRFHLFRFKITSFINKDEMLGRQIISKLSKKLTVEEMIQKEKYFIYNQPKDVCLLVKKETEGIQIDISEVYQARYLDQIEQVNDTLILVWRSDQSQNIIKKPTAQNSSDQQVLQVKDADALAVGRIDSSKVCQKKEELIKKYNFLYEQNQQSNLFVQKVLCDKNTLCIKFDNEFIATKVKTSLMKIKSLIRKQKMNQQKQ